MTEAPRPRRRIAIIDAHPDPDPHHLIHAMADACARGARRAGHSVRRVNIADMEFPILHSAAAWRRTQVPADIQHSQDAIGWANHLILLYPLWLGDVPALLKAFLEQVFRPGFALREDAPLGRAALLGGRSARVIVTMGMPAPVYRFYFGAHSLKSLERNVLGFVGFDPVRRSLIGSVEEQGRAEKALKLAEKLGENAN
jgi:putative NADPH-quinone reductase